MSSSSTQQRSYPFASGSVLRKSFMPPYIKPDMENAEKHSQTSSPIGMPRFRDPTVALKGKKLSPLQTDISLQDSPEPAQEQPASCCCQRPACLVMCTSCGHHFHGRVRCRCRIHPTQIYLMDTEVCPKCNAGSLKEYSKDKK